MRCSAKDNNGKRCRNTVLPGEDFCGIHHNTAPTLKNLISLIESKTRQLEHQIEDSKLHNNQRTLTSYIIGVISSLSATLIINTWQRLLASINLIFGIVRRLLRAVNDESNYEFFYYGGVCISCIGIVAFLISQKGVYLLLFVVGLIITWGTVIRASK